MATVAPSLNAAFDFDAPRGVAGEDYDPFDDGSSYQPRSNQQLESGLPDANSLQSWRDDQGKSTPKFVKDSAQFVRSIKHIQSIYPGMYGKAERWKPAGGDGMFVKCDLFGFADIAGISQGRFVCVQTTTRANVAEHIRKYVSDAKLDGVSIAQNLRRYLQEGGVFVILGYYKEPGSVHWKFDTTHVTIPMLDAAIARKRK